ncbi:MAG: hypothetical protein A2Y91_08445 [Chloroflexi bacterium RBG_13_54_8]|nr:MAG: hypothetical protein A2Y91_08445 [Chloroflexi bacterium RBG_13_54_8]
MHMILVGIVLLILGGIFLVAGLTGRPKAVIGIEVEMKEPVDNTPQNAPETPVENPTQPISQLPTRIPPSRRVSTIVLGVMGVFFGIISIMDAAIWAAK